MGIAHHSSVYPTHSYTIYLVMVQYVETLEAYNATIREKKRVVVDFTASWCGPCQYIAPVFEELAKKHADVTFIKVDVDENEEAAASAGISCMPTFQFHLDGVRVAEMQGADKDQLEQNVTSLINMTKAPEQVPYVDTIEENHDVIGKNEKVIVDFTASWCGPCQFVAPVYQELMNSGLYSKVKFIKVDVDKNRAAFQEAQGTCMPTFKFYSGGIIKDTLEGADVETLKSKLAN